MAQSSETEKLVNGMSSILEEDNDLKARTENEENELLPGDDGKNEKSKLLPREVEPLYKDSVDSASKNASTSLSAASPEKEEEVSKSVTFAEDIEVYDLTSKVATPITVSLDTPVHQVDLETGTISHGDSSKDSPAVLPVVSDSDVVDKESLALRPSDLTLPSQSVAKERPSSTSETAAQEGEHTGHRHFDVSNVDEAELRRQIESENKEDLDIAKLDLENRPLLDRIPSAFTDNLTGPNTHRANQDTIGPLENPTFLKMLNYSVSQVPEDDAFAATSCLDLDTFGTSQPPSDMDGGWAWVVLFAAFFSLSLTGATMFAAGVLMPAILDQVDNDMTKVSWIGAVHISITCMSGPFVGIILNRVGARLTAFLAGLILSIGLITASFASSVIELIFTHGFVADE